MNKNSKGEVRDAAFRLLAVRQRSREELKQRLLRKDFTREDVEACLDSLERAKLIDDRAFAQLWVEGRAARKGLGRDRLRQELLGKGVNRALVEEVLKTVDQREERQRAKALAIRRWKTMGRLAPDVAKRRLYGILARRGFDGAVIRAITSEIMKGEDHDDERD